MGEWVNAESTVEDFLNKQKSKWDLVILWFCDQFFLKLFVVLPLFSHLLWKPARKFHMESIEKQVKNFGCKLQLLKNLIVV